MSSFQHEPGLFETHTEPAVDQPGKAKGDGCFVPTIYDEYEVKLIVPSADSFPDLSSIGQLGAPTTFELNAVYFDTPDFDLFAEGSTLRRRSGGSDAGWHLKVESPGVDDRREYQAPIAGARPPAQLRQVLSEKARVAPLLPVVRMVTTRTEIPLLDQDGRTLALISEDQVRTQVRPDVHDPEIQNETDSWFEVEVEYVSGPRSVVPSIENAFVREGAVSATYASKLERSLQSWTDRGAPVSERNQHLATAAEVVMSFVATQIGIIQALEQPVVADHFDAVHRVRVAIRRLRGTLRSYEQIFDSHRGRDTIEHLLQELRWYSRILGEARDGEVLREHVARTAEEAGVAPDSPDLKRILNDLERTHTEAHDRVREAAHLPRYEMLQDELVDFLLQPPLSALGGLPAEEVLPGMIEQSKRSVYRSYLRALEPGSQVSNWHDVRKKAKRVRYFADALASHFSGAAATAAAWEQVTDTLGSAQDAVVANEALFEIGRRTPDIGKTVELLCGFEESAAAAHLTVGKEAVQSAFSLGVIS